MQRGRELVVLASDNWLDGFALFCCDPVADRIADDKGGDWDAVVGIKFSKRHSNRDAANAQ